MNDIEIFTFKIFLIGLISGFLLVLISGCSSTGNSQGVLVQSTFIGKGAAFAKADEHCRKFGKHARATGEMQTGETMFDCV